MLVVTESNFKITQAAEKMDCRQRWEAQRPVRGGKMAIFHARQDSGLG